MYLPTNFPELEALREKMEAEDLCFKPMIDIQSQTGSVSVLSDEFDIIDNEIPTVQNRKASFYIWDARAYRENWNKDPRYHVVNCEKLQEMKEKKRFGQYRATRRTDRKFPVTFPSSDELIPLELVLCRYCLTQLKEQYGERVFPENPMEFPLADWFETFDYDEKLDQTGSPHVPFDYSSEAWRARSIACRQSANWKCKQCRISLKDDSYFLHTHHKWGTRFNDPEDLIALCIRCHAEQPGHGHETLKYDPGYQEFMKKYGGVSRSSIRFNLPSQQSQHTQGQSTPTYLQTPVTEVTEEDTPF